MYFGIKLCLLIVSVYIFNLDISNANSAGPPPAACDSMQPGAPAHAVPSGLGAVPHTLTVNGGGTMYVTGETITLTLAGTPQFRGFFIQARRVDSTSTRVGSWTAGSGQSTASCPSSQAISHNSGSLKSSETITFTAPDATTTGDIQFYFTVVQERTPTSIYWYFQPGPVLTTTIPTTSTTSAPTITSTTASTMMSNPSTTATTASTMMSNPSATTPTPTSTSQTTAGAIVLAVVSTIVLALVANATDCTGY